MVIFYKVFPPNATLIQIFFLLLPYHLSHFPHLMSALSYLLQLLQQNPSNEAISEASFAEFLNQPKTEQLLQKLANWEAEALAEWKIFVQKKENEKTKSNSQVFTFELDPRIEADIDDLFSTSPILKETLVLPNAIIGKNYHYFFDFRAQGLEDVKEYEMEGLEDAGLEWDTDASTIYGIPHTEGEFDCFVKYKLFHHADKHSYQYKKMILNVLASPNQKINKNIPSDEDEKYWKPDEMKSLILEGEKQIFAASRRGYLHASEGEIRSDDFGIFYDKNTKWYIITLASGAENAKFGRKGAQIAAKSGLSFLANKIRDEYVEIEAIISDFIQSPNYAQELGEMLYNLLGGAVLEVSHLLEEEANAEDEPYVEYAASVSLIIMRQTEKGWAIGSLGMGENVMVLYQKGEVKILHDLNDFSREDITQTEILKNLPKRLRFHLVSDFEGILLFTEGVKSHFFKSDFQLNLPESWQQIWVNLTENLFLETEKSEVTLLHLMDWLEENQAENDGTIILVN